MLILPQLGLRRKLARFRINSRPAERILMKFGIIPVLVEIRQTCAVKSGIIPVLFEIGQTCAVKTYTRFCTHHELH